MKKVWSCVEFCFKVYPLFYIRCVLKDRFQCFNIYVLFKISDLETVILKKKQQSSFLMNHVAFSTNQPIMKIRENEIYISSTKSFWFLNTSLSSNASKSIILSVVTVPASISLLKAFKTSF